MRKFKETKKQFDKVREDLELSLVRNAQAPRHRPHEVEEATGALTVTRKCFRHLALDYVLQVSGQRGARVPGAVGVPRAGVCWGGSRGRVDCHREAPLAPENLHCQVWGSDMAASKAPMGRGQRGLQAAGAEAQKTWRRDFEGLGAGMGMPGFAPGEGVTSQHGKGHQACGRRGWAQCRELKTSRGSQGTTAAGVDSVARYRP